MTKRKSNKERVLDMHDKIVGTVDSLVVTDPPTECWDIWKGSTKELTFKLTNTGYHIIKNLDFTAYTYMHTKEQGDIGTSKNYAEVGFVPKQLDRNSEIEVKVKVSIPDNYVEVIKYEGHTIKYPFRVATKTVGIESIEEI